MSLKFSIVSMPTAPGKYRAMVQPGERVSFERFLRDAPGKTSLSPSDLNYVIDVAVEWIITCALNGQECNLGDLGRSRLGLRGTFDTPVPARITHDDVEVTLSWTLSPKIRRILQKRSAEIELEQVQPKDLSPVVSRVSAPTQQGSRGNVYWPGYILHVQGDNLSLDYNNPDEGVFFRSIATGQIFRAGVYQRAAIKNIVCQTPSQLAGAGELRLEVRRRPRAHARELLVGEYEQTLEEFVA